MFVISLRPKICAQKPRILINPLKSLKNNDNLENLENLENYRYSRNYRSRYFFENDMLGDIVLETRTITERYVHP